MISIPFWPIFTPDAPPYCHDASYTIVLYDILSPNQSIDMIYRSALTVALGALLSITHVHAQPRFDRVYDSLRQQVEYVRPDGRLRTSKQLARWKWFWSSRLNPDSTLPTALQLQEQLDRFRDMKTSTTDRVQATAVWKELGPIGRPADNVTWQGIGRINCIAFNPTAPDEMWAGSAAGGLWHSVDAGGHWRWVPIPEFPIFGISDIAVAPSNSKIMYISTGDNNLATLPLYRNDYGLLKSTDGGLTWKVTGLVRDTAQPRIVSNIVVHPSDPDRLLVSIEKETLLASDDGGATFRETSNRYPRDLISHPTKADVVYSTSAGSIVRSSDFGMTWNTVHGISTSEDVKLAVTPAEPELLIAIYANKSTPKNIGIHVSHNGGDKFEYEGTGKNIYGWDAEGMNWDEGGLSWYALSCEISPYDPNLVFVGSVNIWKSTTSPRNWQLAGHWNGEKAPFIHADQHLFKWQPGTDRLWVCNDGGIYLSTDNGTTWQDRSNGLSVQQYYRMTTSPIDGDFMLAGAQDNGTTYWNGSSFRHILGGDGMDCAIDANRLTTIYATLPYGDIVRSSAGVAGPWTQISGTAMRGEGADWIAPIVAHPTRSNVLYAGYKNVWMSTDSGDSWTRCTDISGGWYATGIWVSPYDPDMVCCVVSNGLFESIDAGKTWKRITGVPVLGSDIAFDPVNRRSYLLSHAGYKRNPKVTRIIDGVASDYSGTGLPNIPVNAIVTLGSPVNQIVIGTDLGVFTRLADRDEWIPFGGNMPTTVVLDLEYVPSKGVLRAATFGRGIWELSLADCMQSTSPSIDALTPIEVCIDDTVVLEASSQYRAYQWSTGDTTRRIQLTDSYRGDAVYLTTIDANGCIGYSNPIRPLFARYPVTPRILRYGNLLRAGTPASTKTFQWFIDGVPIEGATTIQYRAERAGRYRVLIGNAQGCTTMSEEFAYDPATTVEHGDVGMDMTIWPNPADERIDVDVSGIVGPEAIVEIINGTGSVVLRSAIPEGQRHLSFPLSSLGKGVYLIRLHSSNRFLSKSFIHH